MNTMKLTKLCCGLIACAGLVTSSFAATNANPTPPPTPPGGPDVNVQVPNVNIKVPNVDVKGPKVNIQGPDMCKHMKNCGKKKIITLKKGTTQFNVELPSNKTTGYSWFLGTYDHKLFTPVGHEYIKPKNGKMGAPGMERWTFKVDPKAYDVPRMTKMKFIYAQPWDLKDHKMQKVMIVIQ